MTRLGVLSQSSLASAGCDYEDVGSVRAMLKGQRTVLLVNGTALPSTAPDVMEKSLESMFPSAFLELLQSTPDMARRLTHGVGDVLYTAGLAHCGEEESSWRRHVLLF